MFIPESLCKVNLEFVILANGAIGQEVVPDSDYLLGERCLVIISPISEANSTPPPSLSCRLDPP